VIDDLLLTPPVPVPDAISAGYWEAAAAGQVAVCRCQACRRWMHPPQEACRHCGADAKFEPVSGRGTVFSWITVRQMTVPGHQVPYVVAVVELEEQPGLRLTGILAADSEDVRTGLPVQAAFTEIGKSGIKAPYFEVVGP
jgi:uncharacterized OB-fold protein